MRAHLSKSLALLVLLSFTVTVNAASANKVNQTNAQQAAINKYEVSNMEKHPEHEAVTATVNNYLLGISNADQAQERLQAAFYSSTNLHSLDENGDLRFQPRDMLVEMASSGSVPEHKSEIMGIEVTNDMAFAKIHLDMPDRHFYDYLTLLKMKAGWRIVSKTYTTVMK